MFSTTNLVSLMSIIVLNSCVGGAIEEWNVTLDKEDDLYYEWKITGDFTYLPSLDMNHRPLPPDLNAESFENSREGIWMIKSDSELIHGGNGGVSLIRKSRETQSMFIAFTSNMFPLKYLYVRFSMGGKSKLIIRSGANDNGVETICLYQPSKNYSWIDLKFDLPINLRFVVESQVTDPLDFVLIDQIVATYSNPSPIRTTLVPKQKLDDVARRWPGGGVPFQMMNTIDKGVVMRIRYAMALIETSSENCVRFIPMSTAQIVQNHPYHLRIIPSGNNGTCWANLDTDQKNDTHQEAVIDSTCSTGSIIQQLMRVVGYKGRDQNIPTNKTGSSWLFPEDVSWKFEIPRVENLVPNPTNSTSVQNSHPPNSHLPIGNSTNMDQRSFLTLAEIDELKMMYNPSSQPSNEIQPPTPPRERIEGLGPDDFADPDMED